MADSEALKTVIEEVKAKIESLQATLKVLEALNGEVPIPTATMVSNRPRPRDVEIQHDTFVGMNIVDAAARYLGMVGRPARSVEEITNALNRGGLTSTAGSVQTLLSRSHNGPNPVVRRAGRGTWGLPSWYTANA
jgi:hypothetical protein